MDKQARHYLLDPNPHLDRVEHYIREATSSATGLLREVADYVQLGGGKLIRPRLLLLVAESLGSVDERVLRVAAGIELVHTASLLHDDVVDQSAERRGRPSVNAQFGDDVAILIADLLFAHAFDLALSGTDPEIMRTVCQATRRMCESEIFQIERRSQILSEEDYLHIIDCKTATLFATSTRLGGTLCGVDSAQRDLLAEFGRNVGLAFQVADDVLDYTGDGGRLGKPTGQDLAQGKQTLPLVRAFHLANDDERQTLIHELRNGREMSKVLPVIQKYEGIEYSNEKARSFARVARDLIDSFDGAGPLTEVLHNVCTFAAERSF